MSAHWLLHLLGIDTQQSPFYDFWSGLAPSLGLIGGMGALVRRHNCHVHRCWRVGRHAVAGGGYLVCRRHHPDPRVRAGAAARYIAAAHEHHQRSRM